MCKENYKMDSVRRTNCESCCAWARCPSIHILVLAFQPFDLGSSQRRFHGHDLPPPYPRTSSVGPPNCPPTTTIKHIYLRLSQKPKTKPIIKITTSSFTLFIIEIISCMKSQKSCSLKKKHFFFL